MFSQGIGFFEISFAGSVLGALIFVQFWVFVHPSIHKAIVLVVPYHMFITLIFGSVSPSTYFTIKTIWCFGKMINLPEKINTFHCQIFIVRTVGT